MILIREMLKSFNIISTESRLDINKALSHLHALGSISDMDLTIVQLIIRQFIPSEIAYRLNINRATVYRKLNNVCKKLENSLGEAYHDSQILTRVEERLGRKLTPDEQTFCNLVIIRGGRIGNKTIFNFRDD